jgi:hypothetical protein
VSELELFDRWSPDEQLIPALLAGSPTTMADLGPADRAWVVAGMRLRGMTADAIADRLECSLRLVRSVSAEPITAVAMLYQREAEAFADEYRMVSSELRRLVGELAEAQRDRDRCQDQLSRMLDRFVTGDSGPAFRCGHPKTRYNSYTAPKTGKVSCRQCHAAAQATYRARRAAARRTLVA